jgi:hypothetical protein
MNPPASRFDMLCEKSSPGATCIHTRVFLPRGMLDIARQSLIADKPKLLDQVRDGNR